MSHFRPVELRHASRLLNHGPTVLITSRDETLDRRNVMAAAWSMPVEFEPPRIAIVVDKSTWSRELIERSRRGGGQLDLCGGQRQRARRGQIQLLRDPGREWPGARPAGH